MQKDQTNEPRKGLVKLIVHGKEIFSEPSQGNAIVLVVNGVSVYNSETDGQLHIEDDDSGPNTPPPNNHGG